MLGKFFSSEILVTGKAKRFIFRSRKCLINDSYEKRHLGINEVKFGPQLKIVSFHMIPCELLFLSEFNDHGKFMPEPKNAVRTASNISMAVEGNQGYGPSFGTILCDIMWLLPRYPVMTSHRWHDSRISLECWECKKYQTCYIIMASSVNEKRSILTYL